MNKASGANRSVRSVACPFCERINPPDSRFCNDCGAPLYLVPCFRCGAVNDPTAPKCHQCGASWPGNALGGAPRSSSGTEALDAAGFGARTAEDRVQPIAPAFFDADGLDRDGRLLQQLQRVAANSDSGSLPDGREGVGLGEVQTVGSPSYGASWPASPLGGPARSSPGTEAPDGAGFGARTAEDRVQPSAHAFVGADVLERDARLLQQLQRVVANSDSSSVAGGREEFSLGDLRTLASPSADAESSYPASAVAGSRMTRVGARMLPRWGFTVIIGSVVLAVFAAAGYYAYRARPVPDVPQSAAVGGAARASTPTESGALVNSSESGGGGVPGTSAPSLAVTPAVAADAQPIAPAHAGGAAAVRSGTAPPEEARSAATPPVAPSSSEAIINARRAAAEAGAPAEAVSAGSRPRTERVAPGVIERQPARVGACTEAVAAVGLCAPESVQRKE